MYRAKSWSLSVAGLQAVHIGHHHEQNYVAASASATPCAVTIESLAPSREIENYDITELVRYLSFSFILW